MKEGEIKKDRDAEVKLSEPYLIDYVAGGVLSGGMAWIWSVALNYLISLELFERVETLYPLSIGVYIIIAFSTSFLVSKRFEKGHVVIGLKTSLFSWAAIIFTNIPPGGKVTTAITLFYSTLFFCMILGGYLGGTLSKQIWSREIQGKTNRERQ